jgi:hypothetical protein
MLGEIGVDPGEAWTMDTAAGFTSALNGRWWTANHTLVRHDTIKQGVTSVPSPFIVAQQWDSLPYNTFDHLGWHDCNCHPTSIKTWEQPAHNMFVYPNPVIHNKVIIKATTEIEDITITDLSGKTVLFRRNQTMSGTIKINDLQLEQGLYLLNARFEDDTQLSKKLYIQ